MNKSSIKYKEHQIIRSKTWVDGVVLINFKASKQIENIFDERQTFGIVLEIDRSVSVGALGRGRL